MMRMCYVLVLAAVWQVSGAVELRLTKDGGLTFDGGRLSVSAFRVGWTDYPVKIDWNGDSSGACKFRIGDNAAKIFDGKAFWTMQGDGTVKGAVSLTCIAPAEAQCLALRADIPAVPPFGLGDGTAQDYELPVEDGRAIRLHFDVPVRYHAQDSRQWGKAWSVRFGQWQGRRKYAVGDRLEWNVTLSSSDGLTLKRMKPCVIAEGVEWVKMDHRKDIKPGSALDLSAQGLQDAPAGKHGWLKAKDGHFEFEGLPGVEQRFYGVNLCFVANYLSHEDADMLVARLVRCGYNTIRVHHHDGMWAASAENREKLDYLVAKCIERGIYITTDLYVSRPVKWREIGIDRDGEMQKSLYKTYIGIYEPAFTNWCSFTKAFLSHVNPYTGRSYADEPGMPLVSLINEGVFGMDSARRGDPKIIAAWHAFGGKGDTPPSRSKDKGAHRAFDEWINAKIWTKCSAYVRSLGAKALLTNDNNGWWHAEGEGLTPRYDYVDNHFYVDHPTFLDEPWRLPSRCWNKNPIRTELPAIFHAGWAKGSAKPYTITEWNFSGPGHYRGMGGILTGALAAEQEWDGLWRFAYSHSNANLKDNPNGGPSYFDCVTDPIIAASDRASVCLYLRGDAAQIENVKCKMENGKCVRGVWLDKENGSMTIVTSRTCGGFTESEPIEAGPLSFSVCTNAVAHRAVPTTLWVSTLDGKAIRESSRMLLTHLTDVQGEGTKFADETRTILLKWGRGCLAEIGAADVSLRLAEPHRYQVWALASDGERRFEVPCRVEKGALCFTASIAGPNGAQLFYEIAFSSDTAKYLVVDVLGGPHTEKRAVRTSEASPNISGNACRTGELWFRRLPGADGIAVSVFEITQTQYEAVTGGNPARHPGALRPVENVSWEEAMAFAATLSRQTGLAVDLPTDAEWEYACRAGTKTDFYNGKNPRSHLSPELDPIARYGNNRHDGRGGGYAEHVHAGSYEPNSWGLYDMLGNVSEWTRDWSSEKFPGNRYKSLRGGNWYPCTEIASAFACMASSRGMARYVGSTPEWKSDLVGFRVVVREEGMAAR